MSVGQPLSGMRVVDITSVVMGPFGSQILADLGAEVTVIEDRRGDANRAMGTSRHPELSGVALGLLRNKRSIGLDLKSDAGRAVLGKLIEHADVFITNLRPAPRARLGITYSDLSALNPRLVYCAACGYLPDDERADLPAYDDVIQGVVGIPVMNQQVGMGPNYFPTILVDKVCGMAISQAVTAALFDRERRGVGVEITLSMYEIMRGFMLAEHGADAVSFPGERPAGYERVLADDRAPQPTADGHIAALPYERHHFQKLFRLAGRDDLVDDPRIETRQGLITYRSELRTLVRECLATRTTAEWLCILPEHGVPVGPLNTLDDLIADLPHDLHPHAGEYVVIPTVLGESPEVRRPAPLHGEDTVDVLVELGYSDDEIEQMFTTGAAHGHRSPGP